MGEWGDRRDEEWEGRVWERRKNIEMGRSAKENGRIGGRNWIGRTEEGKKK